MISSKSRFMNTVSPQTYTESFTDHRNNDTDNSKVKLNGKNSGWVQKFLVDISPFTRPNDVLSACTPEALSDPTVELVGTLYQALRNASVQIDRLNKYRLNQKRKNEQLQHRLAQMNKELDATVDTLRFHQSSSEGERRRSAAELADLRLHLARANSMLAQQKRLTEKMAVTASSESVLTLQTAPTEKRNCNVDGSNDVNLQLETTKAELSQLHSGMMQLKVNYDRETSKLRGQLAESMADVRALRAQMLRLQNSANSSPKSDSTSDSVCSNCSRLQRLLDIMQSKSGDKTKNGHRMNSSAKDSSETPLNQQNVPTNRQISPSESVIHDTSHPADSQEQFKMPNGQVSYNLQPYAQTNGKQSLSPEKTSLRSSSFTPSTNINGVSENASGTASIDGIRSYSTFCNPCSDIGSMSTDSHSKQFQNPTEDKCVQTSYYDRIPDYFSPTPLPVDLLGETFDSWNLEHASPDLIQTNTAANNRLASWQTLVNEVVSLRRQLKHHSSVGDSTHPGHPNIDNPNKSTESTAIQTNDAREERLLNRLHAAEREAEEAVAQLKASNAEFLALKERVSHAAAEREYLRSCVEGLDEQVSQLEQSLYERTQLLNQCRNELAMRNQAHVIPIPQIWSPGNGIYSSNKIQRFSVSPYSSRFLSFLCRPFSFLARGNSTSLTSAEPSRTPLLFRAPSALHGPLGRCLSILHNRLIFCRRPRLLIPPPGRTMIFFFLIYFIFVHFLLIRLWFSV